MLSKLWASLLLGLALVAIVGEVCQLQRRRPHLRLRPNSRFNRGDRSASGVS